MRYYTYQTTALLPCMLLFLFGAAYRQRLASYDLDTVSKTPCVLVRRLLGLLFNYFRRGMYRHATPGLQNECLTLQPKHAGAISPVARCVF